MKIFLLLQAKKKKTTTPKPQLSSQLPSNLEITDQDEPSPSLALSVLSQPPSGRGASRRGTGGQESLPREAPWKGQTPFL